MAFFLHGGLAGECSLGRRLKCFDSVWKQVDMATFAPYHVSLHAVLHLPSTAPMRTSRHGRRAWKEQGGMGAVLRGSARSCRLCSVGGLKRFDSVWKCLGKFLFLHTLLFHTLYEDGA